MAEGGGYKVPGTSFNGPGMSFDNLTFEPDPDAYDSDYFGPDTYFEPRIALGNVTHDHNLTTNTHFEDPPTLLACECRKSQIGEHGGRRTKEHRTPRLLKGKCNEQHFIVKHVTSQPQS
jgi:hypothetical protein